MVVAVITAKCLGVLYAGYGDMYALIRSMVAADYDGSIILDHTPSFEEFAGEPPKVKVFQKQLSDICTCCYDLQAATMVRHRMLWCVLLLQKPNDHRSVAFSSRCVSTPVEHSSKIVD